MSIDERRAVLRRAARGVRRPRRRTDARRARRPGGWLHAGAGATLSSAAARVRPCARRGRRGGTALVGDDARALANMRATLPVARRARADTRRPTDRRRRDRRGSSRCPGASGALPALRAGGRVAAVRRGDDRPADGPRSPRHRGGPGRAPDACSRRSSRSGGSSTATAATAARTGGCSGRAPRAGPSTARRSRRTPSRSGLAPDRSRRCSGILAAWRAVVRARADRAMGLLVRGGAAARRLDRLVPADAAALNDAHLASLGADPARPRDLYDILPRPGRPPSRSRSRSDGGMGRGPAAGRSLAPRPPWVFATYAEGGLGNLLELLHESGHALHMAAIRTRPAFLDFPEATAAFSRPRPTSSAGTPTNRPGSGAGWARPPSRARRSSAATARSCSTSAGRSSRSSSTATRSAARTTSGPRSTADGLGVVPHPEWSWWAIRGQLDRRARLSRQLRAVGDHGGRGPGTHRELRGRGSTGDPGWYRFVADALFVPGASRPPADLLETFLGGPLTAEPLLADLRRAGYALALRPGISTSASTATATNSRVRYLIEYL